MNWTKEKESEIRSWIIACENYVNEHTNKKKYNKKISSYILIITIFFSITTTVLNGVSSFSYYKILNIIATIIGGLSATVSMIIKQIDPEQNVLKHGETIAKYKQLIMIIKYQLNLDVESRNDCNEFMKSIMELMINLEAEEDGISIISKSEIEKMFNNLKTHTHAEKNEQLEDVKITSENKKKFELFFKQYPSMNENMLKYQMDIFDRQI